MTFDKNKLKLGDILVGIYGGAYHVTDIDNRGFTTGGRLRWDNSGYSSDGIVSTMIVGKALRLNHYKLISWKHFTSTCLIFTSHRVKPHQWVVFKRNGLKIVGKVKSIIPHPLSIYKTVELREVRIYKDNITYLLNHNCERVEVCGLRKNRKEN